MVDMTSSKVVMELEETYFGEGTSQKAAESWWKVKTKPQRHILQICVCKLQNIKKDNLKCTILLNRARYCQLCWEVASQFGATWRLRRKDYFRRKKCMFRTRGKWFWNKRSLFFWEEKIFLGGREDEGKVLFALAAESLHSFPVAGLFPDLIMPPPSQIPQPISVYVSRRIWLATSYPLTHSMPPQWPSLNIETMAAWKYFDPDTMHGEIRKCISYARAIFFHQRCLEIKIASRPMLPQTDLRQHRLAAASWAKSQLTFEKS